MPDADELYNLVSSKGRGLYYAGQSRTVGRSPSTR